MDKKTKTLTFTALLVALTVVLLYIASVLPTSRIGVTTIAGLLVASAVIEYGVGAGLSCFAVSAVLAAIIIPLKSVVLLYVLFFGCYPIIKSLIERMKNRAAEWALKLLVFNAALTVLYFLWRSGFLIGIEPNMAAAAAFYAVCNVFFALYDIAFTRLAQFYISKIHIKR